jgi:hypothetical protein
MPGKIFLLMQVLGFGSALVSLGGFQLNMLAGLLAIPKMSLLLKAFAFCSRQTLY